MKKETAEKIDAMVQHLDALKASGELSDTNNMTVTEIDSKVVIIIDAECPSLTPKGHFSLVKTGGFRQLIPSVNFNLHIWRRQPKQQEEGKAPTFQATTF